MKLKLYFFLIVLIFTVGAYSQAPEKLSYQAVIRDASNVLVTNHDIGMRISILQGSATGTAVFVETQTPTTNENGLATIEIGGGTFVTGTFAEINWATGVYFIKTETDPTGGTSYTITGTSQILSVPYALHAKTSESITSAITETDPVYLSSQAANITASDITNLSNLSGVNTGDQDLSALTTKTALGDSIANIRSEIPSVKTYSVGDFAQGGIVFWVDDTGRHGLVCAKTDCNGGSGVRWYAGTHGSTQAKGDGIYAGNANTLIIIAAQVAIGDDGSTYAARVCNELQIPESGITYSDWYLPSKYELNLMYENKTTINATATANGGTIFATTTYWSSTEHDRDHAWILSFDNGYQLNYNKYDTYRVRAIRYF